MTKKQVVIGGIYLKKVSGKLVRVRIDREYSHGKGWMGTNLETSRDVRVKSASGLRPLLSGSNASPKATEPPKASADKPPKPPKPPKTEKPPKGATGPQGEPKPPKASPPVRCNHCGEPNPEHTEGETLCCGGKLTYPGDADYQRAAVGWNKPPVGDWVPALDTPPKPQGDLPPADSDVVLETPRLLVVKKNGQSKPHATEPLPQPTGDLPPPAPETPKAKKAPKKKREKAPPKPPKPPRVIPDSSQLADLVSLKGVKVPREMLAAATAAAVKQGRTLQDVVVAALCNFGQMGQTASDPCPHCGDPLPAHPLPRRSHLKACEKKHANGGAK